MCNLINTNTHTHRERERGIGTILVEAGGKGRGEGGGGQGGGREGGESKGMEEGGKLEQRRGTMDNRHKRRTQRQVSRKQKTSGAGRTKGLEESVSGLCLGYNRSSCVPFTHIVEQNSWKTSETKQTTRRRERWSDRGAREKGAMAFVEYLWVSQEDPMESSLWRETLGRSLESQDAGKTSRRDMLR